jgi:hypothetical protein
MPHRVSPHFETTPERFWPAWLFSLLFHSTAIVLLAVVIQTTPRGAADSLAQSPGIVLETSSAAGDLSEADESGNDTVAVEPSPPVEVSPPLRNEQATTVAAESVSPTPPLIPAPAQPPSANAVPGSNQPNAVRANSAGSAGRGSPGGRGAARVSVFGVQGQGNKFVYLFDRSSSMDGAPLAAAKRQLVQSLASLQSVHQFHVVFFNTRTQAFDTMDGGRRLAFATDRNKQLAARFVGGITADGGTDRLTALKQAIASAPDVIFFLTDSDDPMSPGELAEVARDNSRARAAICTIEFGRRQSPSPGNFLAELARQSGGQYGYVNTSTFDP